MDFTFTEEQELFRDSVRALLERDCDASAVRALWDTEQGRSPELWRQLAEIGLLGLLVPEQSGGLGMDEIDFVLPLIETGRAALPAPIVDSAVIATALLRDIAQTETHQGWLVRAASGESILTAGHPINAFVADAHIADVLLLVHNGEVHAVLREEAHMQRQECSDPARHLYTVDWEPSRETRVAGGGEASVLLEQALDRGAFATAAQMIGAAQRMVDMAVAYAGQRQQFGVPIGSFQAVKHMLASVQVQIEFAKPVLYRAAYSLARGADTRSADVSAAKLAAGDAATAAAKTALQAHGAIGYTWECDLQIWMKRVWSLDLAWGRRAWHGNRLADAVVDGATPARSFGYEAKAGGA